MMKMDDVKGFDPEIIERTCPNCGMKMDENRCKLNCPKCGYFKSCSDF